MQNDLPLFANLDSTSVSESDLAKHRARIQESTTSMAPPPLINPLKNGAFSLKERGAYYTSKAVADFLVRWAIRSPRERVLDPSFGGGVFLHASSERLRKLRGIPERQIFGIEVDSNAHIKTSSELRTSWRIPLENLWARDFFDVEPAPENQMDVVVGNPPYIRYQRFTLEVRKRALSRAAEQGVKLTQLSSSWAPFVIHAVAMTRIGGRLAMVLPAELTYAKYATPVLKYLTESFDEVTLLTFKRKLFPEINEDTILLLADRKGGKSSSIMLRDLNDERSLNTIVFDSTYSIAEVLQVKKDRILERRQRLIEYLLPAQTRNLYNRLKEHDQVKPLGDLADVGIGYVTGANSFFHLSPKEVTGFKIPDQFLKSAVKRSRAFQGLDFTHEDWNMALESGESAYLLCIDPDAELPKSVADYIRYGKERGFANAYKCRNREPWYSVPHVHRADGFLSYMSTETPALVINHAGAVAPNTLHVLRMYKNTRVSSTDLASSWLTSLTRLSAEIEGHSLGGGMLKLEPTEAENCLVAVPNFAKDLNGISHEIDSLLRQGEYRKANMLADRYLLRDSLNLTPKECQLLSEGAELLMNRRRTRSQKR